MLPLDIYIKKQLGEHLESLENELDADFMAIVSPLVPGIDRKVREALELKKEKRGTLAILLDTQGGVVEVVARMVEAIRFHYEEVGFVIPDRAMSAGTVFAVSGNRIYMDYFSCLGPIDPQIEKEGKLVPALAYLNQFETLNAKAAAGELTTAEYALIDKMDPGELYQFQLAKNLSIKLLKKWLSEYKFKNWVTTETHGDKVTKKMKEERAEEVAQKLSDIESWHSHGFGISMNALKDEVKLKIEDLRDTPSLHKAVREYWDLLKDYLQRENLIYFVHTREYF